MFFLNISLFAEPLESDDRVNFFKGRRNNRHAMLGSMKFHVYSDAEITTAQPLRTKYHKFRNEEHFSQVNDLVALLSDEMNKNNIDMAEYVKSFSDLLNIK